VAGRTAIFQARMKPKPDDTTRLAFEISRDPGLPKWLNESIAMSVRPNKVLAANEAQRS
jgi:hypothetical protein